MPKLKDLTGQKFGRLTVIERAENKGKDVAWLCRCECGNEIVIRGKDLKNGKTQSCGCLRKEVASDKFKEVNERWQDEDYRQAHIGKNHYLYNHDLTDEDRDSRKSYLYKNWSKSVKRRANYICDCCKKDCEHNANAHHLEDYHSNQHLRYDVSNGVCLCEHCHKEFHVSFMRGYDKPCAKQDYDDFKAINKLIVKVGEE